MRKIILILISALALSTLTANATPNIAPSPSATEKTESPSQTKGTPIVSSYISNFFMEVNCYIEYKEPGKKPKRIYCSYEVFESLCNDYDMMKQLESNVKHGITSQKDYNFMESKFEKKYSYYKDNKNVYRISMSK